MHSRRGNFISSYIKKPKFNSYILICLNTNIHRNIWFSINSSLLLISFLVSVLATLLRSCPHVCGFFAKWIKKIMPCQQVAVPVSDAEKNIPLISLAVHEQADIHSCPATLTGSIHQAFTCGLPHPSWCYLYVCSFKCQRAGLFGADCVVAVFSSLICGLRIWHAKKFISNCLHFFKVSVCIFSNMLLTFSWLNLTRSLSQLKDDRRRRCSDLKSDPDRREVSGWMGIQVPCWNTRQYQALNEINCAVKSSQHHPSFVPECL